MHGMWVILPCWQQVRGIRGNEEVSVPSADTSMLEPGVCQPFQAVGPLWKVAASCFFGFFLLPASCTSQHVAKIALLPLEDLLNLNVLLTAGSEGICAMHQCRKVVRREVKPRIIKDISDWRL